MIYVSGSFVVLLTYSLSESRLNSSAGSTSKVISCSSSSDCKSRCSIGGNGDSDFIFHLRYFRQTIGSGSY